MTIAFVTSSHPPAPRPDLLLLGDAAAARGAQADIVVWDDPTVDWTSATTPSWSARAGTTSPAARSSSAGPRRSPACTTRTTS
ncbi:hypothetical protein [Aeromicrobium sp. UC242_57]|uniref:hypothetical protein n=1 Tax=Aeromicrobium sp. UC242_57 TaxID=3374624 RepID=UPI003798599A